MFRILSYSLCIVLLSSTLISKVLAMPNYPDKLFNSSRIQDRKKFEEKLLENDIRPTREISYSSPSKRFLIHYDLNGEHAVNNQDLNNNGIPDYVDSVAFYMDRTYQVEVIEMGYLPPLEDTLGGSKQYDIYLTNLVREYDAIYGLTGADYSVNLEVINPKYITYIYLENDYSPFDSIKVGNNLKSPAFFTTGINGLKISTAHEFHHAIQFAYGDDSISYCLRELSSTYMESRLYPDVLDYLQYTNELFHNFESFPFGNGYAEIGYRWSILGQYFQIVYSDNLLKKMWEYVGIGQDGYQALNSALIFYKSSLNSSWKDFFDYIYYTNYRSVGDKYLPNANKLPNFDYDQVITEEQLPWIYEGTLFPYEIKTLRLKDKFTDISLNTNNIDLIISNFDLESSQKPKFTPAKFKIEFVKKAIDGYNKIDGSDFYYKLSSSNDLVDLKIYLNEGALNSQSFAFPQPYNSNLNRSIYLSLPKEYEFNTTASIEIYNSQLSQVKLLEKRDIKFENGLRVLEIQNKELNLQKGIYLYLIKCGENSTIGKFALIN